MESNHTTKTTENSGSTRSDFGLFNTNSICEDLSNNCNKKDDNNNTSKPQVESAAKALFKSKVKLVIAANEMKEKSQKSASSLPEISERVQGVSTGLTSRAHDRKLIQEANVTGILFPWDDYYKIWWGIIIMTAYATAYTTTYDIAFGRPGYYSDAATILEYVFTALYSIDIGVHFFLAYYDENDVLVCDRKRIAVHYLRTWFFWDIIAVFPFHPIALAATGNMNSSSKDALYIGLLKILRLSRLNKFSQLDNLLSYHTNISLLWFTLIRNFSVAFGWAHFSACVMYFMARVNDFADEITWIGTAALSMTRVERYVTSLYWSVTTLATVGYGDYSPQNAVEQSWGSFFMMSSIVLQAWMIGSITLLVVKNDEKTGRFREALQLLKKYAKMHDLEKPLEKSLKKQLKLEFTNRDIADEEILKHFPTAVRRKVLRRLYLPSLLHSSLMEGIRQQFVDEFLSVSQVEIFGPGEELMHRGCISSHLYLLVAGVVQLIPFLPSNSTFGAGKTEKSQRGKYVHEKSSVTDSENNGNGSSGIQIESGNFINELGFFTESPQVETIVTKTACKILTISRSTYKSLAEDHPGSVGKILHNLLRKAETLSEETGNPKSVILPKRLDALKAGSMFDDGDSSYNDAVMGVIKQVQSQHTLTAVRDLIKMHMHQLKDDHTTRFLFAASRGDITAISLMCEQGIDPNSVDYDNRSALMVASMKGNTDAVIKILEYQANPNLVDIHGTSALYEATKNGHDDTMKALLAKGATLCLNEGQAAMKLCQCVYDGDMLTLRRLLRARIMVNAADYDKRTPVHIAAAEGNVAAVKLLVGFGADLSLQDRWGKTALDEAKRIESLPLLDFMQSLPTTPKE